jgi:hypothetical protein
MLKQQRWCQDVPLDDRIAGWAHSWLLDKGNQMFRHFGSKWFVLIPWMGYFESQIFAARGRERAAFCDGKSRINGCAPTAPLCRRRSRGGRRSTHRPEAG